MRISKSNSAERRAVAIMMLVCVAFSSLTCNRRPHQSPQANASQDCVILCSFLPIYVFTLNIVGDTPGVRVEMLMPPAAGCPHDYETSTRDAKRMARADVLVVLGGMDDGLTRAVTGASSRAIIRATGPDEHEHVSTESESPQHAADEHPWVSPRRSLDLAQAIADGLCKFVPDHSDRFRENAAAYIGRLRALAREVDELAVRVQGEPIVTVHDIFNGLARDLGLEIVGTIRPSENTEPSPRQVHDLIRLIRARHVKLVISEPQYPRALAEQIAAEGGATSRELDPVATAVEPIQPDLYENAMRTNLGIISDVLADGQVAHTPKDESEPLASEVKS